MAATKDTAKADESVALMVSLMVDMLGLLKVGWMAFGMVDKMGLKKVPRMAGSWEMKKELQRDNEQAALMA